MIFHYWNFSLIRFLFEYFFRQHFNTCIHLCSGYHRYVFNYFHFAQSGCYKSGKKKIMSPDWFYQYFECMINYPLEYLVFAMLLAARTPSSCWWKEAIFWENSTLVCLHISSQMTLWQIAWSTTFILTSKDGVNLQIWDG